MNTIVTKKTTIPSKKNRTKRATRPVASIARVFRAPGFPDHYYARLVSGYTNQSLGAGTGVAYGRNAALNALSVTATGYVALSSVYDKYFVHAAKLEVSFYNLSATIPVRTLVVPLDSALVASLPLANDDDLTEIKYAKIGIASVLGGGHDTSKLTVSASMKSLSGIADLNNNSAVFGGFTGSPNSTNAYSSPADLWKFYFSV